MSLLPPNAAPLERELERGTARAGAIPLDDVAALWDPAACPLDVLPWLAWALSVDTWDAAWPESTKREAVAGSIALHRRKGTRLSVETVLARFDALLELVEWWQASPPAAPHTFEVHLPIAGAGAAPGGIRATAAFAEAIIAEVSKVKPLREHFRLAQRIAVAGTIGLQAVARPAVFAREETALTIDTSQPWTALLQDENGEPLSDDASAYLDTRP